MRQTHLEPLATSRSRASSKASPMLGALVIIRRTACIHRPIASVALRSARSTSCSSSSRRRSRSAASMACSCSALSWGAVSSGSSPVADVIKGPLDVVERLLVVGDVPADDVLGTNDGVDARSMISYLLHDGGADRRVLFDGVGEGRHGLNEGW